MLQKIKIYRIDRGAETAVYQAWLLKKKSDFQFFVKKKVASNDVKKNLALTSTEKKVCWKKVFQPPPPDNEMVAP